MNRSNNHYFNSHLYRFWCLLLSLFLFPLTLFPLTLNAETTDPSISESSVAEAESPVEAAQTEEEVTEEAREREKSGEEDPLAQRQADRIDRPIEWSDEANEYNFYGSARIRFRESDSGSVWGDGGSRVDSSVDLVLNSRQSSGRPGFAGLQGARATKGRNGSWLTTCLNHSSIGS